jgi:hypothetical protein
LTTPTKVSAAKSRPKEFSPTAWAQVGLAGHEFETLSFSVDVGKIKGKLWPYVRNRGRFVAISHDWRPQNQSGFHLRTLASPACLDGARNW